MKNRILASLSKHRIWIFPVILTFILLLLTALRINGSSMGVYHAFLYKGQKDPAIVLGVPRPIRSDEWVVNTQMIIAQKNNDYKRINHNIGNGEDMSLILDVPYKEWSEIFRPQNWPFFVLPFDYAFAMKWWLLGYLLILSCYIFTVTILPRKILIAAGLSLSLFFSPFVQWWYQYITIAPLYYCLFATVFFLLLLRQKKRTHSLLLTAALAYTLTCFALVLYPPFQIPCALVTAGLCLGYLIESFHPLGKKVWLQKLGYAAIALAITALASLTFLVTRSDAVHTVQNTAYPGKRVVASGGYSLTHLFSGNLDAQLKTPSLVDKYQMPKLGVTNQSEASSFFFVWPFLILPSIVIIVRLYMKEKRVDWPLTIVTGLFFVALLWLFVPHLGILGKVLLLNIVPHNRFIIGLGLLGIIQIPLIIRSLEKQRSPFTLLHAALYSIAVLCIELVLDFHVKAAFPGFIGQYRAIAFALPAAAIIFALLRRMNNLAALGLLAFTAFMTIGVNPLYRGTAILTSNKVIAAISKVSSSDPTAKWVIEDGNLENFAIMGGAPSLSGIYTYPQLQLWQPLDKSGNSEALYNRYAHVSINLDRDGSKQITDGFIMPTFDHFGVKAEPCGNFLRSANVHYALTEAPLSKEDSCAKRIEVVTYPTTPFYLYRVH